MSSSSLNSSLGSRLRFITSNTCPKTVVSNMNHAVHYKKHRLTSLICDVSENDELKSEFAVKRNNNAPSRNPHFVFLTKSKKIILLLRKIEIIFSRLPHATLSPTVITLD